MSSTLEVLRRLVKQHTTGVGTQVKNLVGPVSYPVLPIRTTYDSRWRVVQVPGTSLPSLDDFYQLYASQQQRNTFEVAAINGVISLIATEPSIFGIRGMLQVPGSLSYTIGISSASQGSFAVYLDGVLVRTGAGDREFQITMQQGSHLLEILVVGRTVALQMPLGVPVSPVLDVLAAPTWSRVIVGYADVQAGTSTVDLYWNSDVRAGGWIVLRRERVDIGFIVNVTEADVHGEFGCEIAGDVESLVAPGTTLYSGSDPMGVVLRSEYDAASTRTYNAVPFTGLTTLSMRLMTTRSEISSVWVGTDGSGGTFREIRRVQRTLPSPIISWQDTAVAVGEIYEYALQAYGLFDPAIVGPWSTIMYVVAGDNTPPADITILGGTPTVLNRVASVRFTTPTDSDYAGVKTEFSEIVQTGTVVSVTTTTVTLDATPAADPTGQWLEITGGTGSGQAQVVLSSTGAIMDTYEWDTPLDGTSVYELRVVSEIITDYGVPNTEDQFSFALPVTGTVARLGRYNFKSFDLVGNTQGTGVVWNYTGAGDETFSQNQPPVVGLRQLTPAEQVIYNADTTNVAIVELSAADPVDGTTGVTIQYRGRHATFGTSIGGASNTSTTLNDTGATWGTSPDEWANYLVRITGNTGVGQERTITSNTLTELTVTPAWTIIPDATSTYEIAWRLGLLATSSGTVVDNPTGTRGRLVEVNRTTSGNWIHVRAVDQDGLPSDILTYSPDYDTVPEFSSVVVRVDELQDQVSVTGIVDDDCRSMEWWVMPRVGADPYDLAKQLYDNLEIYKTFSFSFSLFDGQSRTLYLTPFAGLNRTGVEGIDVAYTVSRSPRTTVTFENQRPDGGSTAQYSKATFFVSPSITDATTNVTGMSTGSNTTTTLNDTNASWTTNQWTASMIQITGGTGAGQVREIASNTITEITVTAVWTTTPDATTTYQIANTSTGTNTSTTLNDTSVGWDLEEWGQDKTINKEYYVRITAGPGVGQVRLISSNTATALTITPDWTTIPTSASDYVIQRGAILYRELSTPTADAPYKATVDPVYIERTVADKYIDYYSMITGVPPEPVRRAQLDQDDIAELGSDWTTAELVGNVVTITLGSPDDDVRRWQLFARKGDTVVLSGLTATGGSTTTIEDTGQGWVVNAYAGKYAVVTAGTNIGETRLITSNTNEILTTAAFTSVTDATTVYDIRDGNWPITPTNGNLASDPLDLDYQRFDVPITVESVKLHLATGADWYFILVPYNSLGEAGVRESRQIEVVGSITTDPVLSNFTVTTKDNGISLPYNQLNWDHNDGTAPSLETPYTKYYVRVYAYRQDLGSGTQVEITDGIPTRHAWMDVSAGSDWSNSNDVTNEISLKGSILHQIEGMDRGGTYLYRWIYTVELWDSTGAPDLLQTKQFFHIDNYTPQIPTVSSAAASLLNGGTCAV